MTQIKLGDQVVDLSGTMPSIGSKAPDFLLANNDLVNMTLKDFEGKRLVLNIFPSLATPVCSASAHKFNELASDMNNRITCYNNIIISFCYICSNSCIIL